VSDHRPGFDAADLTTMTVVELAGYLAQLRLSRESERNMFVSQALQLRMSEVEREIAIRNVRETIRQEGSSEG
jgi:hypothetical protein